MTPAQLASLKSEIQTDPLHLGYSAYLPNDPTKAADLINAQTQSMVKAISSTVAMKWAAQGPEGPIEDAAANAAHPCRASCEIVQKAMSANEDIHMEDPDLQTMFSAWVTNNVITQAQHDALMQLATQAASRAEVLGLPPVTARDIVDCGAF